MSTTTIDINGFSMEYGFLFELTHELREWAKQRPREEDEGEEGASEE